jgi:hypothetical protein
VPEQRRGSVTAIAAKLDMIDAGEKHNPGSRSVGQREDPISRLGTEILVDYNTEVGSVACPADG